VVTPLQLMT